MNVTVQIPHGPLQAFAPNECRAMRSLSAYLTSSLPHVTEFEQGAYLRAIRDLEFAATPESHFDMDHYTPPGYVPGWVADP